MREIEKIAENLFEKIRSRFADVSLGDENAEVTSDANKARFFNFNYISDDGTDFGNITISIIDENNLKLYFSKNISRKLDDVQRKEWYAFLYDMRKFARRNLMVFDTRDISRSNLKVKDLKAVSKTDRNFNMDDAKITESRLYGTPKTSYENVGSARIVVRHTESVDSEVRGSRARHINAIYVENAHGERFRMQHNKLSGARAMARHVAEGGMPYDDVGTYITEMVQEMNELGTFVRGMRNRTFEDTVTKDMMEAAVKHYQGINRQLNNLKGSRTYQSFVESFESQPQQLDEVDMNDIRERFVKKTFNDRMESALPYVYRAYQLQEQFKTRQLESVKNIISNKSQLQLATNEGMDEYMKVLSFADAGSMVVSVLEDIARRAVTMPEVAEFARHWASNWKTVNEDGNEQIKEHRALAVKLATQYIKDLGRLKESAGLRTTVESELLDNDRGMDILGEGSWAVPSNDADIQELAALMKEPLQVGVDATNATSALYHLLGDDDLFDRLGDLAEAEGPEADARDTILYYLESEMPGLVAKLGLENTGVEGPGDEELDAAPNRPTQPAAPDASQYAAPKTDGTNVEEGLSRLLKLCGMQSVLVR